MSRGPGKVEREITSKLKRNPDAPVELLCQAVYIGNAAGPSWRPSRSQRVSVCRALRRVRHREQTWENTARQLGLAGRAISWHIGDWLKFGIEHWGEDETRKSALEIFGLEEEAVRTSAWVASKFELPRRRNTLSFSHHAAVAALPRDEADLLLDRAESQNWSVDELHTVICSNT